ncbi:hypothetical protein VTN77DRAFT_3931 [Rasamsonia byssochlamydoides]|uniref:uncharacterized protein n=1 Tax=Rasamsonia byssochlamydoides TaxID=89139 RepID=UPI00374431A1
MSLFEDLLFRIEGGNDFKVLYYPKIRFTIPAFRVQGTLKCEGALFGTSRPGRDDDDGTKFFLPLTTFSVVKNDCNKNTSITMATNEVPQILVQSILAYNQNPTLENYSGFVVSIDGTIVHISQAFLSHAYMENLCKGGSLLGEHLEFCRSESYDLLECDRRREVLRLIIGIFRFHIT